MDSIFRPLIIGFGNLDRADDGVAFYVINTVRRHLGQAPLPEDDTGLDDLGGTVDAVFLSQLTPELTDIMKDYNRILFVDAHVYENLEALHCLPVVPETAGLTFTHHISPAMLLALVQSLYQCEPAGYLVSIRGCDFDFHRVLAPETAALVEPAVRRILSELTDQVP